MNKNLPKQHGVISTREFSSGPGRFIIKFSIGVHGFRQNPCMYPTSFSLRQFITLVTDKILYKSLSFSIRDEKPFEPECGHPDWLIFQSSRAIYNRIQYWGKSVSTESMYPILFSFDD